MSLPSSFFRAFISILAAALLAGPAYAEKPAWAGKGEGKHAAKEKGNKQGGKQGNYSEHQDVRHQSVTVRAYFGDRQRAVAREYFQEQSRAGHCPPGLAKKNNGCMPPGQAKKWSVGRALPPDVIYYSLSPELVIRLGQPPAGYKYVRVASDILLIAIGTSMVVDAISDLAGL